MSGKFENGTRAAVNIRNVSGIVKFFHPLFNDDDGKEEKEGKEGWIAGWKGKGKEALRTNPNLWYVGPFSLRDPLEIVLTFGTCEYRCRSQMKSCCTTYRKADAT
jgi:hypothetical protein